MLYSKYYLYNITVAKNEVFALAKDNIKKSGDNNIIKEDNSNIKEINTNYYLCKWNCKCS